MSSIALLVIDMQVGLLQSNRFPMLDAPELTTRVADLVARARKAGVEVIFVQHCGGQGHPLEMNTPGWDICSDLGWLDGDVVVRKRTPDAFHNTNLQKVLDQRDITTLVICGLQSDYCVDTTVRRAFSLGYRGILVQDGHSTCNSRVLSAEQIVAHENLVLGGWFAKLLAAKEVNFLALQSTC